MRMIKTMWQNFLPDSLSGLTRILSSLTRREAVFVGEAAAIPSRIRIRKLEEISITRLIRHWLYVKVWSNDLLNYK